MATPWLQLGQIETISDEYGTHLRYAPTTLSADSPIVVLAHGTPAEEETAADTARYYVETWKDWAEARGALLLAPAFDQRNFTSKDGEQALGGYRGLFGRKIGADSGKFYLYGHSAGGQFVAHFLVTHPERLHAAVITAAAIYPFPDADVQWPYGLGTLAGSLQWKDPVEERPVHVVPDVETWLAGLEVRATVIVGMDDMEPQPVWPGQKGTNRAVRGWQWVEAMRVFAAEQGVESRLAIALVPKVGHSMLGLLPFSQEALLAGR